MRTPEDYRKMAEEVRTCGDLVTNLDCKRRLYECAGEYEAWADQVEDRLIRNRHTVAPGGGPNK